MEEQTLDNEQSNIVTQSQLDAYDAAESGLIQPLDVNLENAPGWLGGTNVAPSNDPHEAASWELADMMQDTWANPEGFAGDPYWESQRWAYDASHNGANFERYYAVPRLFQDVGFSPWRDNEKLYKERITWWEDFKRSASQSASIGWVSFKSMLPWNAMNPEYSDQEMAESFEKANAIGASSLDGFGGWFNNMTLQSGFTLGMLAEFAAEELILWGTTALITAGTGGTGSVTAIGSGARTAAHTGTLIYRMGKAFKSFYNVSKNFTRISKVLSELNKIDNVRQIYKSVKLGKGLGKVGKGVLDFATPQTLDFLKYLRKDMQAGKALNTWATAAKGAGAFYRDVRAVNAAVAESKLEAGMVQNELFENMYNEWRYMKDENGNLINEGKIPSKEEFERWRELSANAAMETFWWNVPILFLSNKVVFDRAFKGILPLREFRESYAKNVSKTVRFDKAAFKAGEDAWQLINKNMKARAQRILTYRKQPKNMFRDIVRGVTKYTKNNWVEGAQEIWQDTASGAIKNYYLSRFSDPSFSQSWQSWKEFGSMLGTWGQQLKHMTTSKEGLDIFMSGFLMGGFVQVPQHIMFESVPKAFWRITDNKGYQEYREQKEKDMDKMVNALNEVTRDFSKYNNADFKNLVSQYITTKNYIHAGEENDAKSMLDADDESVFEHMNTLLRTGRLEIALEALADLKGMNSREFTESFGKVPTGVDAKQYYSGQIDSFTRKAKSIQKRWETIDELYPNHYDTNRYSQTKQPEEWMEEYINMMAFEDAKKMAVFAGYSFDRAQERMANVMQTASHKNPLLKNASPSEFQVLFQIDQIQDHEQLLKEEIESLEAGTPAQKGQAKIKKEKLDALTRFRQNIRSYRELLASNRNRQAQNIDLTTEEQEMVDKEFEQSISDARDAYINYTMALAEESGERMDFKTYNKFRHDTRMEESFEEVLDFYELESDSMEYAETVSVLTDPQYFTSMAFRSAEVLKRIAEQKEKLFRESYAEVQGMEELNGLINRLTDLGVYFDPEQLRAFKEEGKVPTVFHEMGTGQPISPNSEKYKKVEVLLEQFEQAHDFKFTDRPISGMTLSEGTPLSRRKLEGDKRTYADYATQFGFEADAEETEVPIKDVLNAIIKSDHATPREKALATRLLKIAGDVQKVKFRKNHGNPGTYTEGAGVVIDARYSSEEYRKVSVPGTDATLEQPAIEYVILHNQIHYLLNSELVNDDEFAQSVEGLIEAGRKFAKDNKRGNVYGLTSEKDFIAEVMTNEEFQRFLQEVPYEATGKSAWTEFVNSIFKFLSKIFKIKKKDMDHNTVLNEALHIITTQIDKGRTIPKAEEIRKTPSEMKTQIKEEFDNEFGTETMLVGSVKRGEARTDSDVDILMPGMPHAEEGEATDEQMQKNSEYAMRKLRKLEKKKIISNLEYVRGEDKAEDKTLGVTFTYNNQEFHVHPNPVYDEALETKTEAKPEKVETGAPKTEAQKQAENEKLRKLKYTQDEINAMSDIEVETILAGGIVSPVWETETAAEREKAKEEKKKVKKTEDVVSKIDEILTTDKTNEEKMDEIKKYEKEVEKDLMSNLTMDTEVVGNKFKNAKDILTKPEEVEEEGAGEVIDKDDKEVSDGSVKEFGDSDTDSQTTKEDYNNAPKDEQGLIDLFSEDDADPC